MARVVRVSIAQARERAGLAREHLQIALRTSRVRTRRYWSRRLMLATSERKASEAHGPDRVERAQSSRSATASCVRVGAMAHGRRWVLARRRGSVPVVSGYGALGHQAVMSSAGVRTVTPVMLLATRETASSGVSADAPGSRLR